MSFSSPYVLGRGRVLATIRNDLRALRRAYDEDGNSGLADLIERKEREQARVLEAIEKSKARAASMPPQHRQATIRITDWAAPAGEEVAFVPYSPGQLAELRKAPNIEAEVHLPVIAAEKTPVAHLLLASPLFAATRRTEAQSTTKVCLGTAKVDGKAHTVRYEGPQLTTSHGDVFFGCLACVQQSGFDAEVEMRTRDFLELIGRCGSSGANHAALSEELKDLNKGTFFLLYEGEARTKRIKASDWRLLNFDVEFLERGGVLRPESVMSFRIPSATAVLFGLEAWSALDLQLRGDVRSPTTKWLIGYLASRGPQGRDQVEQLHHLSGCRQKLSRFRASLRDSVDDLKQRGVLTASSSLGRPSDQLFWSKTRPRGQQANPVEALVIS